MLGCGAERARREGGIRSRIAHKPLFLIYMYGFIVYCVEYVTYPLHLIYQTECGSVRPVLESAPCSC